MINPMHPRRPMYPMRDLMEEEQQPCTWEAGQRDRREFQEYQAAAEDCEMRRNAPGYEAIMNTRIGGSSDV